MAIKKLQCSGNFISISISSMKIIALMIYKSFTLMIEESIDKLMIYTKVIQLFLMTEFIDIF